MTTLSTLIGPAGSSLTLGGLRSGAAGKPSFWQRIGGAIRGRRRTSAVPAVTNDVATVDALNRLSGDDADNETGPDGADAHARYDDDVSPAGDSVDRSGDSWDEHPGRGETAGTGGPPGLLPPTPPRRRLLWGNSAAKRDAALDEVRNGMGALANLLNGIQSHLEKQGAHLEKQGARQDDLSERQKEIVACLTHLPAASAAQTENLLAIREQMSQGSANQARLCAALERLSGLQETTGEALTSIGRRIDTMDARDAGFAASMEKVCDAMQSVSRASETGAVVLDRVQTALASREDKMALVIERQQTRFTALMAVAIAVSAAALATVAGVGYLVITRAAH